MTPPPDIAPRPTAPPSGIDPAEGAAREQFVSEQLVPAPGSGSAAAMARGEPGLPARFTWRGDEFAVRGVLRQWKTSGPCHSGAGEVYLRRHWYRVVTDPPAVMTVYCERQARAAPAARRRWFIYTIEPARNA